MTEKESLLDVAMFWKIYLYTAAVYKDIKIVVRSQNSSAMEQIIWHFYMTGFLLNLLNFLEVVLDDESLTSSTKSLIKLKYENKQETAEVQ